MKRKGFIVKERLQRCTECLGGKEMYIINNGPW